MLVKQMAKAIKAMIDFLVLLEIPTSRRMWFLLSFLLSCARRKSTAAAKLYVIENIIVVWIIESRFRVQRETVCYR
jgi:hypothetical protein